jgi:hypothetical protein
VKTLIIIYYYYNLIRPRGAEFFETHNKLTKYTGEDTCGLQNSIIKGHPSDLQIKRNKRNIIVTSTANQSFLIEPVAALHRKKCRRGNLGNFSRVIFISRDPYPAIFSDYQREFTSSHVGKIGTKENPFEPKMWSEYAVVLADRYKYKWDTLVSTIFTKYTMVGKFDDDRFDAAGTTSGRGSGSRGTVTDTGRGSAGGNSGGSVSSSGGSSGRSGGTGSLKGELRGTNGASAFRNEQGSVRSNRRERSSEQGSERGRKLLGSERGSERGSGCSGAGAANSVVAIRY